MNGKTIVENWRKRTGYRHIFNVDHDLIDAIDSALAAEREAALEQAASIAESNGERGYRYEVIAAAIRARKP